MTEIDIKLTDTERVGLGKKLMEQVTEARQAMRGLLSSLNEWDRYYESRLRPKDFPWPHCSNMNVPVIQSHVDTLHAAVNDTVLGADRIMSVLPPAWMDGPDAKAKATAVDDLLHHVFEEWMNVRGLVDEWDLLALKEPAGIVKVPWREEVRQVKRNVNGEVQTVNEQKYRGPKPELVDLNNFVIYPLTSKGIDEAILVGDRFKIGADELKRRAQNGWYDQKAVDLVVETGTLTEEGAMDERERAQADAEKIEGTSYELYECWELITGYDANKDGLTEDCVFIVEATTQTILRATEYPYWHGRRFYIAQRPFPRARRFFGRCLPQILEGCQAELNAVHNQRVDATAISISKPFKRSRSTEGTGDNIVLAPGMFIDVDHMDEIGELEINPVIPGVEYEQIAKEWAERADGVGENAMGRETKGDETLGELKMISARGGQRHAILSQRLHSGLVELAKQTLGLLYQFAEDPEITILTGGKLVKEELILPWRFVPRGTVGAADKQFQQQSSLLLYKMLSSNPLVLANPKGLHRLTQDVLTAFDRDDPESYMISPEEFAQMQAQQAAAQQSADAQQQAHDDAMTLAGGKVGKPRGARPVARAGSPVGPGGGGGGQAPPGMPPPPGG
jgi:hypothetical protein